MFKIDFLIFAKPYFFFLAMMTTTAAAMMTAAAMPMIRPALTVFSPYAAFSVVTASGPVTSALSVAGPTSSPQLTQKAEPAGK